MNGIQKVRIGMGIVASSFFIASGATKALSQTAKSAKVIKPQQIEVGVPAKLLHKLKRTLKLGIKYDNYNEMYQANHLTTLVKDLHKEIPKGYDKYSRPLTFEVVQKNNQEMIAVNVPEKTKRLTKKEYLKELENPSAKPDVDTLYFPATKEGVADLKRAVRELSNTKKHNAAVAFRVGFNKDIEHGTPDSLVYSAITPKGDGVTPNAFRFVKVKDDKKADFSQIMGNPFHKVTEGPNMYTFDAKTNKLKGKVLN